MTRIPKITNLNNISFTANPLVRTKTAADITSENRIKSFIRDCGIQVINVQDTTKYISYNVLTIKKAYFSFEDFKKRFEIDYMNSNSTKNISRIITTHIKNENECRTEEERKDFARYLGEVQYVQQRCAEKNRDFNKFINAVKPVVRKETVIEEIVVTNNNKQTPLSVYVDEVRDDLNIKDGTTPSIKISLTLLFPKT